MKSNYATTQHQRIGAGLCVDSVGVTLAKRQILKDVSFEVEAQQWLAIIGPNGAGKSTLIKCITSLIDHTGEVTISDSDRHCGRTPTPLDVALVPQRPVIPTAMTVAQYVLLGRSAHISWFGALSDKDRRIAAEMIELLDLSDYVDRNVSELSGGEIQRVVLARTLTQQSPILVLDEPTSALDIGHEDEVLELVDHLRITRSLTIISVMHNLSAAARYAQKLALIADGELRICDNTERVLKSDELCDAYETDLRVVDVDGEILVLPPPRNPHRSIGGPG